MTPGGGRETALSGLSSARLLEPPVKYDPSIPEAPALSLPQRLIDQLRCLSKSCSTSVSGPTLSSLRRYVLFVNVSKYSLLISQTGHMCGPLIHSACR
jgi:hypothetical protein